MLLQQEQEHTQWQMFVRMLEEMLELRALSGGIIFEARFSVSRDGYMKYPPSLLPRPECQYHNSTDNKAVRRRESCGKPYKHCGHVIQRAITLGLFHFINTETS